MTLPPAGVATSEALARVVREFSELDEFAFDVETRGDNPLDPQRNEVFWISLAGLNEDTYIIPLGHPVGERVLYDDNDTVHRINPRTRKHEERRINPDSGREKWFQVDEPFLPAYDQLWRSEVFEALRPLFFSSRRKVGHNVKFDLESVAKYYNGEVPSPPYADTLVAARLVNESFKSYSLVNCIDRAFRQNPYDLNHMAKLGKLGVENFPYEEARLYSHLDVKYTWLLWQDLKQALERERIWNIFDLEMQLMPGIMDMEMHGTLLDLHVLRQVDHDYSLEIERLQLQINQDAGQEINLNATVQLAEFLYDRLGYTCVDFTEKTQARQVNRQALERHEKDPRVARILEHKQYTKIKSTFIAGLKERHVGGRIHPTFNQVGARTGRMSCSNPNIQQIPSRTENGRRIRELFVAPPDQVLIVADLSQIELRVLTHFTQDPVLLQAYQEGLDLHGILARRVFGRHFTPTQRMLAKNGNFSILFGAMPKTLVARYGFPNLQTAIKVHDAFYDTYVRVEPWKRRLIAQCRERFVPKRQPPYVTTILGRRCRIPALMWFDDYKAVAAAERLAVSVRIQGTAADLFKLAMIECHRLLGALPYEAHMLMTVHDELVVEAPKRHAEEVLKIVKTSMEEVQNPFTNKPILRKVPIVADAKIVSRWSEK